MKSNGPENSPLPDFWQNDGLPIAVAHRGGDALGVEKENSMAAIDAAVQLGYTWFETDVVATRDDKLLAIHGRGFQMHPNRDLPRRRTIQGMTLREVQQKIRIGGEPPALLEEILSTFPNTKWFIDPKMSKSVAPLAEVLKRPSIDLGRISVGAFSQKRTNAVAQQVKTTRGYDICTSIGPRGAYALLASSDVKISELEPRDRFLLRYLKITGALTDVREIIKASGAASVHVPYRWVNNSTDFVEVAHRYGLRVATWTPNRAEDIAPSLERGADAIMSDNVKALRNMILSDNSGNSSIKQA